MPSPARPGIKVYGWQSFRPVVGQTREIVAAKSAAAAARASGHKHPCQMFNLSPTGNAQEIEIATSAPGVVFWRGLNDRRGEYLADNKDSAHA
jgi:hypothetical protein